jgi:hypothetical protein
MFEHDARIGIDRGVPGAGVPGGSGARLSIFRVLLVLGAISTAAVAAWLFFVTAVVLPARDPAHIPLWRGVAVCCLAFSGMSWLCLTVGSRNAVPRWALLLFSVAAISFGAWAIVSMLSLPSGGHFEGYLVLMGLLLAGHGVSALVYALITMRGAVPAARGSRGGARPARA